MNFIHWIMCKLGYHETVKVRGITHYYYYCLRCGAKRKEGIK